ncbi:MAG: hypothetical protein C6W59_04090 [Paenibacillaceae bacterium]|nr:MAG: hypothetical protein C6W59_04090 [Paenibacillaceae bacterium]
MTPNDSMRPLPPRHRAARRLRKRSAMHKRTIGWFFLGCMLFASMFILLACVVDPLQLYHKPWFYKPVYTTEERYQNAGLAKNYEYETIIIGSSMTENFFPSKVEEAIGGKTMKLSFRGSYVDEQYMAAKLALGTGQVKTVLWGLDYFALKTNINEGQNAFPYYLYDRNFLNDYKYWFNYTHYERLIRGLVRQYRTGHVQGLEGLYNWNFSVKFGEDVTIRHYRKALTEEAIAAKVNEEDPLEVVQGNFNKYVLSLIEAHPDVKFLIYYPPYSILRHVVWRETNPERYEYQLFMKEWMYEQFSRFPNVEVYDFQTEADWSFHLDYYKDMSHHHQDINTWIAQAIGRRDPKYLVTADNVRDFVEELDRQVDEAAVSDDDRLFRVRVFLDDGGGLTPISLGTLMIGNGGNLRVPAKGLAELLGAELEWERETKHLRLTAGDRTFELTVGETTALADGETIELTDPAQLIGGTTFVPLAETAAAFGWEASRTDLGDREFEVVLKAPGQR